MNKKIVIALLCLCVFAIGGYQYFQLRDHCSNHFPSNTIINSIDCSNLTLNQAETKLTEEWNKKSFNINENGENIGTLSNLDFTYDIHEQLNEILAKGHRFPLATTIFRLNKEITIPMNLAKNTDAFKKFIDCLPIYDEGSPIVTENAYVSMENNKFEIIEEVYGNNIDKDKLMSTVTSFIAQNVWTMDFVAKDFYEMPTLTKESQEILDRQDYCKKYLAHEVSYLFGPEVRTITPEEMDKLISVKNEKITVNKEAAEDFVSKLADTYNTLGTNRVFKSSARGDVYLNSRGNYGYVIDEEGELSLLTKNLQELKNVKREPVYSKSGISRDNGDIGYTYVEVDLSKQMLWYYVNNQLMIETPIVSGCAATDHHTVTGVFALQYKTKDVTLKGGNEEEGTDYASDVRYWMPFYGDYGLHDADWRAYFGGNIYLKNGSHGCVNMPIPAAETLYYNIYPGTPVIVYV